jgi:hypothetical protein
MNMEPKTVQDPFQHSSVYLAKHGALVVEAEESHDLANVTRHRADAAERALGHNEWCLLQALKREAQAKPEYTPPAPTREPAL